MNFFKSKIAVPKQPKNKFDLGHERKLTLNMGKLVPIMVQDVVPGDHFKVNTEVFLRFAPMLAPIMHRVNVTTHYFFVPNRLVWNEWDKFITGGEEGSVAPIYPTLRITDVAGSPGVDVMWGLGSLADYMGVPTYSGAAIPTNPLDISALPFRAYQLVYNEYYRDQDLEPDLQIKKTSGDITATDAPEHIKLTTLRKRAWEKDYFTTARPWPQKGGDVLIPVSVSKAFNWASGAPIGLSDGIKTDAAGNLAMQTTSENIILKPTGAGADAGSTINDLRKAFKLQEWLEKQARGGSRYIETILSHFGVKSSDERLQRPEYLGGGMNPVRISEVLSTYDNTAGDLPQGNMSGHGIASGQHHGFTRHFEEHGYVIGIMNVQPKASYQQGLQKHWRKFDKFDHYWPSFANLGEQEVKLHELYYKTDDPAGRADVTFGYQSRYSEYKFQPDTVHGDFRESFAYWHAGRIFDTEPALSQTFIECNNSEIDRIFAVVDPAVHKLWCQVYHSVSALRPMPYHSTPHL